MKRIINVALCSAFVAVASTNALADGIVNGTFEQVSTCPWVALKTLLMDPPLPVVRAPGGNPCSFLKIETEENQDSAEVRQEGFPVRAANDDTVILEFDARVSGTNPSATAAVKFEVTWAETIFVEIPDSPVDANGNPVWVHYKLATQVIDPEDRPTGRLRFLVLCDDKRLDIDNVECNASPDPCADCSDLDLAEVLCVQADIVVPLEREGDLCCLGDINQDGVVGIIDVLLLLAAWTASGETCCCPEDLDGDGDVDVFDLEILLANWGPCGGAPQQVPIEVQKCLDKYLPEDPNGAARCVAMLTTEITE